MLFINDSNRLSLPKTRSTLASTAMSDNEYERFEISDYDLQNEFNPNRRGRRPTKNQQIYGKWKTTPILHSSMCVKNGIPFGRRLRRRQQ